MENDQKDEILEELWQIKDQISLSANKDIRQIVEKANVIAQAAGFSKKTVDHGRKTKIA